MMKRRKTRIPMKGVPLQEVLYEFQRVGHILRVVAIDPVTATEVVMIADPNYDQETIKRLAARKLAYVIEKNRGKAKGPGPNGHVDKMV